MQLVVTQGHHVWMLMGEDVGGESREGEDVGGESGKGEDMLW